MGNPDHLQDRSFGRAVTRLFVVALVFMAFAKHASAEWKENVLYSFQGIPDGAYPSGGVVFDKGGNLYGATSWGGANNCPGIGQCGILYQLQPPLKRGDSWTETVLYVFKGVNSNDGNTPAGGVILDQAGNLYGTTAYGGKGSCQLFGSRVGCGTVFELMPPKRKGGAWTERVLYSFQSGKDGYFPWGDLTLDSLGNLYGATQYGGGYGSCNAPYYQYCGTVFKLGPPKIKGGKWTEKVLYAFRGIQAGKQLGDGANPNGGLVLDSNGAINGTSFYGGTGNCGGSAGVGCGTVFQLSPPVKEGSGAWSEKALHNFLGYPKDGGNPSAGLVIDANRNLYGSTTLGADGDGTIYKLAAPNDRSSQWIETILHQYKGCGDGCAPSSVLVFDQMGTLYGLAASGINRAGVAFRLLPVANGHWQYANLYSFKASPDGAQPNGKLVMRSAETLYGNTGSGGAGQGCQGGCGTVFQITR